MEDKAILGLTMSKTAAYSKFALCVRAGDSEDLEVRKIYEVLPDAKAAREGYLRIVDESGEDYLYPADRFALIKLPATVVRELASSLSSAQQPTSV
jgi:hypothetical protein